jgi:hypothetical protein
LCIQISKVIFRVSQLNDTIIFFIQDYDLSVSENDLLQVCMPLIDLPISTTSAVTEHIIARPENYDETKFIDCYLGDSMDASDDSAYSSDSEMTSNHNVLADLELTQIPAKNIIDSHDDPAIECWDAIW